MTHHDEDVQSTYFCIKFNFNVKDVLWNEMFLQVIFKSEKESMKIKIFV